MNNNYEFNILKFFNEKPKKHWSLDEIKEILQVVKSKKERALVQELNELVHKGIVHVDKKNRYILSEHEGLFKAVVTKATPNFLFARIEGGEEVFVPIFNSQCFKGDSVLLREKEEEPDGKKRVCKLVRVLETTRKFAIGTFKFIKNNSFVEVDEEGSKRIIEVENNLKASEGNIVVVNLEKNENDKLQLEEVLGHKDQPTIDMLSTIFKHSIKLNFDPETLREAEEVSEVIEEEEYYIRRDLREEFIVTIDGADSKDLDDAISLKVLESGNYHLGVHIADVSYYVTKNSHLNEEAYERGTSVYLINKVIPMLPQRLSNNICSLNPHVDRLTLTCEMEIDAKGEVVRSDISESIINSKYRLTYEEVNEFFLTENIQYQDNQLKETLLHMKSLMHILKDKRMNQGAIDFESKEVKFEMGKNEQILSLSVRERKESERMIEEFMLIANETVASSFGSVGLPFIYRVHDIPNEHKIGEVRKILYSIGYEEEIPSHIKKPSQIKKILDSIDDEQIKRIISPILIRMMSKAVYTKDNIGHFGLMKEFYTHFTSPIRRYPDLIVHRLVREMLIEKKMSKKNRDYWERELEPIAIHSSSKEQKAAEAEREMVERKKVEFIEPFIGADFEARVVAMNEHGLFVELENTVQGFIAADSMDGSFNDDTYLFHVGSRTIKVGDILPVKLVSVDKAKSNINFEWNGNS